MSYLKKVKFLRSFKDLERLVERRELGNKKHIAVLNPYALRNIYSSESIAQAYQKADYVVADGFYVKVLGDFFNAEKIETIPGPDLFIYLLENESLSFFLIGSTNNVLEGLEKFIENNIGQRKLNCLELPFKEDVKQFSFGTISEKINQFSPDIIFVSLGAPKQDLFIQELLRYLDHGICIGVGAAFDFYSLSNPMKRAPKIMQKLKIEWLYRLFKERKKMLPRVIGNIMHTPKIIYKELKE